MCMAIYTPFGIRLVLSRSDRAGSVSGTIYAVSTIGNILGITESRVCQIHTKSVLRLRAKLKALMER